ncbi:MAG: VWA domain-containing protein [Treponema sp.]|nr:VWA domain-containing protein [Treponema sp.]
MTNFICERPYALFLLLLLIPVFLYLFIKLRGYDFDQKYDKKSNHRMFSFKKMIVIRTVFRSLAWCMLVLAFSKIYWGTYLAPVQKTGTAVSFVFDISNSMKAPDGPDYKTRLESAGVYARLLLKNMNQNSSVSVVLAKGDGVLAIPLTEDYAQIESLLDSLSPDMMTAPGSSLGKGLLKAKESFPENYASAGRIWLFTDGEETDNHLKTALSECIKAGLPVSIVGFGTERGTSVFAGDNKTLVTTTLKSEKIKATIEDAQKNMGFYKNQTPVIYVDSVEKGSAYKLLSQLTEASNQIITYEAKPVPRYKMFLLIAILCFAFSFIFTEFDFNRFRSKAGKHSLGLIVVISALFTGCSSHTMDTLKGTLSFHQQNYSHSVSCYLKVVNEAGEEENQRLLDYALYNLGTAYSKMGEEAAAMERYGQISENAPETIKYSAFYNAGVIAHKNGDYELAYDYFKKALEVDSTSIESKINMELSLQQAQVDVKHAQSEMTPAAEENNSLPEMEKAIFERIRENDQKQWKNSEAPQGQNLAEDY